MENDRKFLYTVILAVCVLASAILIGKMVLYTDVPTHSPRTVVQRADGNGTLEEPREIALDSSALASLVLRQLPTDCPLDALSIEVQADGDLRLSAKVTRESLREIAELPPATAVLLPSACTVEAEVSVGLDTEARTLVLEPVSLVINGLRLPESFLSPTAALLENALASGLRGQGVTFCSVRTEGGRLLIGL